MGCLRGGHYDGRLWRVVGSPELARSALMLSFLELSEAARVIPHTPAAQPAPPQTRTPADGSSPAQHAGDASNGQAQEPEQAHIIASEAHSAGAAGQERQMRLGFRIEQRVLLRKHMKLLRQHLDRAGAELRSSMQAV